MAVRRKISRPWEKRDTATMCAAKKKPPTRVRPSPMLTAAALSPVTDTRPMPAMHSTAAAMLYRSGRCRATAQYRKGTMTQ